MMARQRGLGLVLLCVTMAAASVEADVKVEKVRCLNQPNCYRLSNGGVEVVVTTDVGPRIIRYAFVGEENLLGETPDDIVKTDLGVWKPWGGHRLWTAPEAMPRSYSPDNEPVAFTIEGSTIRLVQPVEPRTMSRRVSPPARSCPVGGAEVLYRDIRIRPITAIPAE